LTADSVDRLIDSLIVKIPSIKTNIHDNNLTNTFQQQQTKGSSDTQSAIVAHQQNAENIYRPT